MLKPAVIDVARVVCGMEQMLRSLLRDDIELQLPVASASGKVFADHGQLTQIILNLGVNARDAMPAGTIHLPRTDRDIDAPREVVHTGTLEGDETLLIVDDDPQVRAMLRTILTRHGYVVLVAESAGDALLVSEQHPGTIDLLVSDVVMPRMTGPQLVQRLAPQRPAMAVLLCSGYAAELAAGDAPQALGHAFLAKPFRTHELLRAVRDLLDTRPRSSPD